MEGWWEWSVGNGRLLFEINLKKDKGVEGRERGCEVLLRGDVWRTHVVTRFR